ncbi:cation/H(+) antiporter 24 [Malania oleifera]|uniref:cation/H(+) antiporter 24 n=1 Tax=Malania oleifera TaxID=397392 RepID=UPI0025ADE67D|nr:cation/H(+) antiporter 24 [Malania oleifera]
MYLERLGVELVEGSHQALIAHLVLQPTLLKKIKIAQMQDAELVKIRDRVQSGQGADFNISDDRALRFRSRLCVPDDAGIKKTILEEAHRSLMDPGNNNTNAGGGEVGPSSMGGADPDAVLHSVTQQDKWRPSSGGFPAMMKVQVPSPAMVLKHAAATAAAATATATTTTSIPSDEIPIITCHHLHGSHPFGLGIFRGESPLRFTFPLFLFELFLVIIIIHIVRFLLKPLKQPRIVAEAIGGIIIGPSVLGRNKKFAAHVFPENAQFVIRNVGVMAFCYFLFISGVKMDLGVVKHSGKRQLFTATIGVAVPLTAAVVASVILWNSFDKDLRRITSVGAVTSSLAITEFPVLYPVLKELNLLSSEIGREAMSTAIISDIIGLNAIVAFEAAKQGEDKGIRSLWFIISMVILSITVLVGARKLMIMILRRTPEGKPIDQMYVTGILLAVLAIGFLTDFFGIAIGNGPLWLGLAIPDGPPIGATVVERCEAFLTEFLLPLGFATVGLTTDLSTMSEAWPTLLPLFVVCIVGYVTKFAAVLLSSLYFEMPLKDSITLGLILSIRGTVEFILFLHWMDKQIIGVPSFSLLVLLSTTMTAIATPLISIIYNPTRPYMVNKKRTIQHTPPDTELRVVTCIHDPESVAGIINLLHVSNPTLNTPFSVYALRLIELVGRASPIFIDHDHNEHCSEHTGDNAIHNALKQYQETVGDDVIKIHSFTAVAAQRSMYQDICELALRNKVTLIILPFHKDCLDPLAGGTELVRKGVQLVNLHVLAHAPCSVGLLVDKGSFRNPIISRSMRYSSYNFVVLFLGGADAREALAYADRMAGSPDVLVTVVRFLSHNCEGDDEMEKKLDDGVVTWFWVKNERNDRVVYKEVVVRNGAETVAAIRAMSDGHGYDMWIVGRKQGINPVFLEGLSNWSENLELGVVGDFVASVDFGSGGSVLVVQQQILREQGTRGFQESKRQLVIAPLLAIPSGEDGFVIYSDASQKGLKCMLMLHGRVIAYASRQLKEYEKIEYLFTRILMYKSIDVYDT